MLPLTTLPNAQQSHFYTHQQKGLEDDDYAYRVTQIVDEPKKKKNPVARSRPSKKKSRRVSKTYSISTDSGTEMASSPPLPKSRGQYNRGYSRTPSSSHELDILSVQNLNTEAIYARPQRLGSEIVVAGHGSFGSMHHLRSHSQVYIV